MLVQGREIEGLLFRYAQAVDTKDFNQLESCFDPSASIDYGAFGHYDGFAAISNAIRVVDNMHATQHLVACPVISVEADSAIASCYLYAQHVFPDQSLFTVGGRYDDVLAWTAEAGWRFVHRRLREMWTTGRSPVGVLDEGEPPSPAERLRSPLIDPPSASCEPEIAACQLVSAYAHAFDSRDLTALGNLVCADVTVTDTPEPGASGRDQVLGAAIASFDRFPASQHLASNVTVKRMSDDVAAVASDVLAHQVRHDGSARSVAKDGKRWVDEIRRENGAWRLSARRVQPIWQA